MDILKEEEIAEDNDSDDSSEECVIRIDGDDCSENELNELFKNNLYLSSEKSVSLRKSYILHTAASKNFDYIAVGTSDKLVHLYKWRDNDLMDQIILTDLPDKLCGLRFANNDPNILFAGCESSISMFDIRTQDKVAKFIDDSNTHDGSMISGKKSHTCFDINRNDRIIGAGTELLNHDVFILFYDIRQTAKMGFYSEGHDDDISQVKFHYANPDSMLTGSDDGLVNLYDISKTNEDDALIGCMNTECCVETLNWHKNFCGRSDLITCIAPTNDLYLFNPNELELEIMHRRAALTRCMKRKAPIDCNLINCHSMMDDSVFLLASSNYNKGECMRSLYLDNKDTKPWGNYVGNKQIVRTSIYNAKENVLITGGEGGLLSIWTKEQKQTKSPESLKEKSKFKRPRDVKPY